MLLCAKVPADSWYRFNEDPQTRDMWIGQILGPHRMHLGAGRKRRVVDVQMTIKGEERLGDGASDAVP
jgi:hypothetical protein